MNLPFFLLTLAWSVFPATVAQSASDTYHLATARLEGIKALTDNLTQSILGWEGGDLAGALSNIHEPAVGLVEYITNATQSIQNHDTTFNLDQSFRIASPTQRLAYAVNASVAALNRRLPDFTKAKIGAITVSDLRSLLNATVDFSDGVIRHVPTNLHPVAVNLKAQNVDSLQQGIDCYTGTDSACSTTVANPNRTYDLAVEYNAMKADGAPIA